MNTFEYENIIAGVESSVVTEPVEVAPEQDLQVGQVFTLNSDGQAVAMTSEDSAIDVYGIMGASVSTLPEQTKNSIGYTKGQFNIAKIIAPTENWIDENKVILQSMGIFLKHI